MSKRKNEKYFLDSDFYPVPCDPTRYIKDKNLYLRNFIAYKLNQLVKMIRIDGLPETIPERDIKLQLLRNGNSFITEVDGALYSFTGGLGGVPNAYYRPTEYIVANPALNVSKSYKIGVDGVLVYNDTMMMGLIPLLSRYGVLIGETELTIYISDIITRLTAILTAPDDKQKTALEKLINDISNGELTALVDKPIIDSLGINVHNLNTNSSASYITQYVELLQYLKASCYNELGLEANWNAKRESIGAGESTLNQDSLRPLCDDILDNWREGFDKVNKMFSTDITCDYDSSWRDNVIEEQQAIGEDDPNVEEADDEPNEN